MAPLDRVGHEGAEDCYFSQRLALAAADEVLAGLIRRNPAFDPRAALTSLPPMSPFGVLLFQIIGQQISVAATKAILERVRSAFGGRLPSPARLERTPEEVLSAAGVSRRKAATMVGAAAVFRSRRLTRRRLASMTDAQINEVLTSVPGIGAWTVQGFLAIALRRPDAFPAGDMAIRRAVQELWQLDSLPSERSVLERAEAWRPNRALAAAYLLDWDGSRAR